MTFRIGAFVSSILLAVCAAAALPVVASASVSPSDGGWVAQDSGTADKSFQAVWFADASKGWVVGNAGTIRATTDGGATWVQQTSGTSSDLYAVQFIDANHGWASGLDGRILSSTNGGAIWTTQTSGTTAYLASISFSDANHGWAVGGAGTILATTNGGVTWTAQTSGITNCFDDVQFVDARRGWAVGSIAIRATTDGGATWSAQNPGAVGEIEGVCFTDASHGWAVGDSGLILATTNGGTNWSRRNTGDTEWFNDVQFTDTSHGWAVGDSGVIRATSDGGVTWTLQHPSTANYIEGVYFADSTHGWAVGRGGSLVLSTTNGGWPRVYTISPSVVGGAAGHGTVSPAEVQNVTGGTTPTFSFTPVAGYYVSEVKVDGSEVAMTGANQYTFPPVLGNHTISVTFSTFTITPSVVGGLGGHGTVSPATPQNVAPGATPTFTFTPVAGYYVSEVKVDGSEVAMTGANEYTFPAVGADHAISVTFSTFTITPSVVGGLGGHGTLSPAAPQNVILGAAPKFTFTPDFGYRVSAVEVDDILVTMTGGNEYTFAPVSANHTISVEFAPNLKPTLGIPICPKAVRHGRRFTVYGALKPHFDVGARTVKVKAYRYTGGKWRLYKTYSAVNGDFSTFTRYSASVVIMRPGKYRFKAFTAAAVDWAAARTSFSRRLTVK